MDQELIYDAGNFDRSQVNLLKTATSVQEYMQQMIVEREKCDKIASVSLKDIPKSNKPIANLVSNECNNEVSIKFIPNIEWRQLKVNLRKFNIMHIFRAKTFRFYVLI